MKILRVILSSVFLWGTFFFPVFAAVTINEIMYDLSGTDTGREWIEIVNTGVTAVDLTGWKLFEANTNHGLTLVSGAATLPASSFAIIADDTTKFLIDWPSFSGTLFDSSFSLSNTGETLILRTLDLVDSDSVTYSSTQGATGDGNSLQKSGMGWIARAPTPGVANSVAIVPSNGDTDEPGIVATTSEQVFGTSTSGGFSTLVVSAGQDRVGGVRVPIEFRGNARVALSSNLLSGAEFIWSFGDGASGRGQIINHSYEYPGEYIVVLRSSYGVADGTARIRVSVVPFEVLVSRVETGIDGFIELKNSSRQEINIGGLYIVSGNSRFVLPVDTIILAGKTLIIAARTLGFSVASETALIASSRLATVAPEMISGQVAGASTNTPVHQEEMLIKQKILEISQALDLLAQNIGQLKPSPTQTKAPVTPLMNQKINRQTMPKTIINNTSTPITETILIKKSGMFQKIFGFIGRIF